MTFSEKVHTALDVVGMVPVLGEVCDATNAVIYLMEGNFREAAMSGAACIPGFGNAATAAKWAGKGVGFVDDLNDARKLATTASDLSKMAGKASTASKAAKTATDTLTNKTVSGTLQDLYKSMAGIVTGGATADAAKAYDKMKDAGNGLDGIHDAQKAADKAGTAGKTAQKTDGAGGKGGTGSGIVEFKAPPDATPAQSAQVKAYVDGCNEALKAGKLSSTGRVSTQGSLRRQASRAARKEAQRAANAGTPYTGHVGHVPDTTWTGTPDPYDWLDLDPVVNTSLGGQSNGYPIGYKPTGFVFKEDN
ncbi:MAG: hypothetical protein J6J42_07785 [Lachnospiraceae bacterium]|nr:hypothetical protein [Lachnospiraceae bacterium]